MEFQVSNDFWRVVVAFARERNGAPSGLAIGFSVSLTRNWTGMQRGSQKIRMTLAVTCPGIGEGWALVRSRVSSAPPAKAGEAPAPATSRAVDRILAKFTRMASSPRGRGGPASPRPLGSKGFLDLLPELGQQQRLGPAAGDGAGAALQVEGAEILAGQLLPLLVVGEGELALREAHDGVTVREPVRGPQEEEDVLLLRDLRRGRKRHGDGHPAVDVDPTRQDHRHRGSRLALERLGNRNGGDRHQVTVEPLALQMDAVARDDDRGLLDQVGLRAFHGGRGHRRRQGQRGRQQAEGGPHGVFDSSFLLLRLWDLSLPTVPHSQEA